MNGCECLLLDCCIKFIIVITRYNTIFTDDFRWFTAHAVFTFFHLFLTDIYNSALSVAA